MGKIKKVPNAILKGLRAQRGLSQEAMAKVLGMSETSYVSKENGKRDWKSSEMFMMRKFFKCSMDSIFFDKEVS